MQLTRRYLSMLAALVLVAVPGQVVAGDPVRSMAAIEFGLAMARSHLAAGEPQIAESDFRSTLLAAWYLRGLLAVAGGDLPAARDALERSTLQAVVGVMAPRIDLALVQHQLGETDDALQRLRALTRQFRSKPKVWLRLIGTLVADGRSSEVEEQLEDMRLVLPELAAEVEKRLAGLEDSEQAREAWRPRVDLSLLGVSGEDRLSSELDRAIAEADRGLAELAVARAEAPAETRLETLLNAVPESLKDAARAIEQGRLREAEGLLRRAQKQGLDSPDVAELLAIVRGGQGSGVKARLELARIVGREGGPKAALELLSGARQRAPSSEEVLAAYARIAMSAGLTASALPALEPLAGIFPDVAEYAFLLGTAHARLGSMTDAVTALQKSVELAPDDASYRLALAEALNVEKRFDEAELHLIQALETSPEDLAVAVALAQAEEGLDKLESAEERARGVLARRPEHAGAHLVIGMVRMKQERYGEARAALEQAITTGPDAAKAHYQLSLACMRLGDRDAARRHLDLYHAALEGGEGKESQMTLEPSASPAGDSG